MKQKKPLFYIILFTLLIVAIIPYATHAIVRHSSHINMLSKIRNNYTENLAITTNSYINATIKTYLDQIEVISTNGCVYKLSNSGGKRTNSINSLLTNRSAYLGFAILSKNGEIQKKFSQTPKIFDELMIQKRFKKYQAQFIAQQTDIGLCLPIITPLKDSEDYLLTVLSLKTIDPLFTDITFVNSTKLQLITQNGIIIASNTKGEKGSFITNSKLIDKIYSKESGFLKYLNSSNAKNAISYISPTIISNISTNFIVVVSQKDPHTFSLLSYLKLSAFLPLVLLLITVVVATKILYKYINDPINAITKAITFIHSGIFDHQIKLNRTGELGALLTSFEQMSKNLERRFQYQRRMRQEILLRNRYEEKLKTSRAEAVSVSKSKDEFLANISHEIRTPLNAIIGFSEKILMEHPDESFSRNIRTILAESDHLLLLLNDLLDNAKIEADKLDLEYIPFDLHKCLNDTTESFQEATRKKQLSLSLEISEDTPRYVIFDPLRFRQVLVNLLSNAVKFTERGSITVKTAATSITNEHTDVYFSVIDTGIGIPKEKQEGIFNEFSQADGSTTRKYGGTGLGTTISKKLVTLMGGEMCLESELGKGSTFWFTLSLNTNISESDLVEITRENSSTPSDNANKFNGTILVAEDYEVNQELIRSQLEYLGLNVLIAKNGRVALEDCKRIFFDLIFMDLQMPEMGGIEAARRIRIDYPHYEKVPIIALTANADKDIRNVCKAVGMNGILNKPTHIDELAASLLKWLPKSCTTASISVNQKAEAHVENAAITSEYGMYTEKPENQLLTTDPQLSSVPIDLEEAYSLFGNNKIVFNMAINNFISSVENSIIPELEGAFEHNDSEILRRTAHKLKGGAASMTANKLAHIAGLLEKSAENSDLTDISNMIKDIKEVFTEAKQYILDNNKE